MFTSYEVAEPPAMLAFHAVTVAPDLIRGYAPFLRKGQNKH
jgi:hypothetical protein